MPPWLNQMKGARSSLSGSSADSWVLEGKSKSIQSLKKKILTIA
jgi:hypothetical protein